MMAQMRSRHEPQPVPAPHASPTAASVVAPAATTAATSLEVTAWQMQAYTQSSDPMSTTWLGEPYLSGMGREASSPARGLAVVAALTAAGDVTELTLRHSAGW